MDTLVGVIFGGTLVGFAAGVYVDRVVKMRAHIAAELAKLEVKAKADLDALRAELAALKTKLEGKASAISEAISK